MIGAFLWSFSGQATADQYRSRVHQSGGGQGAASESPAQRLKELKHNPYGKALTLRSLAGKAVRGKNYHKAIDYYRQALQLQSLSTYAEQQMRHDLARLYLKAGKSRRAATMLERWLHSPGADAGAEDYLTLGAAYARSERYRKALAPLNRAIATRADAPDGWYRLLLAVELKSGRYREAADTLVTLVRRSPRDKSLWTRLSAVRLKAGNSAGAASAIEMASRQGLLSAPKERLRLARLYLQAGEPYRAAEHLQRWIKRGELPGSAADWELLATAWQRARQPRRALKPLRRAARVTGKGALYAQLGQAHMDLEQWPEAAAALRTALKRGAPHPGETSLALGLAYYYLSDRDKAREAFKSAQRHAKSREQAAQWLAYLDHGS